MCGDDTGLCCRLCKITHHIGHHAHALLFDARRTAHLHSGKGCGPTALWLLSVNGRTWGSVAAGSIMALESSFSTSTAAVATALPLAPPSPAACCWVPRDWSSCGCCAACCWASGCCAAAACCLLPSVAAPAAAAPADWAAAGPSAAGALAAACPASACPTTVACPVVLRCRRCGSQAAPCAAA
jgi:hypothetical protein